MALYHHGRQRGVRSLLMSLGLHLVLLVLFSMMMASQRKLMEQESVDVSLMELDMNPPTKRRRPPRIRHTTRQLTTQAISNERVTPASETIPETIRRSQHTVVYDATMHRNRQRTDRLTDLTTVAENLRSSDDIHISRAMSSRQLPGTGDGIESFRQRASGEKRGGLRLNEPTKIAPMDIPVDKAEAAPPSPPTLEDKTPFGEALFNIGEHIASTSTNGMVDVMFVIDTSLSMQDNVAKVADHLYSMIDAFDRKVFDYRLGVLEFSVQKGGNRIRREPLTEDPAILQQRMRTLRISGDEHALDALMNALAYQDFRGSADKYLILVTDEQASTAWKAPDGYAQLRSQIIDECKRRGIAVNVLGHRENFQRNLANLTGGLWQEIPGGQRGSIGTQVIPSGEKFIRLFRDIGRRIWHASRQAGTADIVIVLDYSGSMGNKAMALVDGLTALESQLSRYTLDAQYGMIRFAEQPDNLGGLKGSAVIQIPIDKGRVAALLEYPFAGDEHLLDAIMVGLPKIQFRPNAVKSLIILTDEPSTGRASIHQVMQICDELGVQVHVIGVLPSGVDPGEIRDGGSIRSSEFQVLAPAQTGGAFHPMPGSLDSPDHTQ